MRKLSVVTVVCAFGSGLLSAAEPPADINEPVGLLANGECPDILELPKLNYRRAMALRTNETEGTTGTERHWPTYNFSHTQKGCRLTIRGPGATGSGDALGREYYFHLTTGDVVPIMGEIYRVVVEVNRLQLERITELVPKELRPAVSNETVAVTQFDRLMFENRRRYKTEVGYVKVKATTAKASAEWPVATVLVQLPYEVNAQERVEDTPGKSRVRPEPIEVTLTAGDALSTPYQSYKVVKVVSPQPLDPDNADAGRLVGWIEVDPKPLPKGGAAK